MSFAGILLGLLLVFRKKPNQMDALEVGKALGIGVIVALHWIFFFMAVKVSNVSVTLGTMASGTLFVSLLEPIIIKRKLYWVEVFIGCLILVGLYLITQFAFHYLQGILIALLSAFLAALFGILNRQLTLSGNDPLRISFLEMFSGAGVTFGFVALSDFEWVGVGAIPAPDWMWLLILAWICTAYAFVATVYLLKHLTTYTVSLAINLEPVYGILLAFFIFGDSERMHFGFYIGAALIIVAIFLHPYLMKIFHKL